MQTKAFINVYLDNNTTDLVIGYLQYVKIPHMCPRYDTCYKCNTDLRECIENGFVEDFTLHNMPVDCELALTIAINMNYVHIAKLIIDKTRYISHDNLTHACTTNSLDVVKYLIPLKIIPEKLIMSLITHACQNGSVGILEYLCDTFCPKNAHKYIQMCFFPSQLDKINILLSQDIKTYDNYKQVLQDNLRDVYLNKDVKFVELINKHANRCDIILNWNASSDMIYNVDVFEYILKHQLIKYNDVLFNTHSQPRIWTLEDLRYNEHVIQKVKLLLPYASLKRLNLYVKNNHVPACDIYFQTTTEIKKLIVNELILRGIKN